MKSRNAFAFLLMLIILSSSCHTPRPVVRLTTDKKIIHAGDSVELSWEVRNPKKATSIQINDIDYGMKFQGNMVLRPPSDTVINFTVYSSKFRPYVTRKKVRVWVPRITLFQVFRDRFNPEKIQFTWKTENCDTLYIEGMDRVLESVGSFWDKDLHEKKYTLVAKTKYSTLTKSCVVGPAFTDRPFIISDTSVTDLTDNREFIFHIFETDVSEFPKKVKLRVVVNDTSGNFIQDLAPPFNSEEFSGKYFSKLVQKVNNTAVEVDFTVREIRKSPEIYDIALALDYSGSMEDVIPDLEQAIEYFINGKYPDDRISLSKFDERILNVCDLKKEGSVILEKEMLSRKDTLGGSTAMYAAVGSSLIKLREAQNQRVILLFTDGHDNSSLGYIGKYPCTLNQIVNQARDHNVKLIIVGLGNVHNYLLRELAYYTYGSFYPIRNPASISKVFNEFQYLSHSYYEIEYKPIDEVGEHIVQLTYSGNSDEKITERPFFIGSYVDFMELEVDTAAYWFDKTLYLKKYRPLTAPQAIVNFDFDKSDLLTYQAITINKIAVYLNQNPGALVKIYGHTDREGTEEYNMNLSQKRADEVKNELLKRYVKPERIECFYLGETQPLWPDETAEWAARENRRVEIVIWEK